MPDPAESPDAPAIPADQPQRAEQRADLPFGPAQWLAQNWRAVSSVLLLATGIGLVIAGWYGAAYTNIITEQIPYMISGGLLGLGLITVAGFMAFSAASERDSRRLREEILRAMRSGGSTATNDMRASTNGTDVFVVPGGRSFHHAGCPIIEGKPDVRELVPADAAREGFVACKLCDTGG